jgi:uracil-DNA glycosylase
MSYVGVRYAMNLSARIVMVGKDHGCGGCADFHGRRQKIREYQSPQNKQKFNAHYRGVVRTAAALLGSVTTCSACYDTNMCQLSNGGGPYCVLDLIAQPNLVKCAPDDKNTMRSQATSLMKMKCSNLLVEELEILNPTLIVFHGTDLRKFFSEAISSRRWELEKWDCQKQKHLFKLNGPTLKADVLFLAHPAYGWLERQWDGVLKEIETLREAGKLPD